MTDILSVLHGLHHMDEDDKALAAMPLLADRMKHHTKRIRQIQYAEGIAGVGAYKAKHPESATIRLLSNTIAYQPKPEGYDAYLVELASLWLMDDAAVDATNVADVGRLNDHFPTRRFNPAKQFSLPLPKPVEAQIRQMFSLRGIPLDEATGINMTDVRKAAKASRCGLAVDRHIGPGVTISGGNLNMGADTYAVSNNGERECIRVRIKGKIRRLYIEEIGWLAQHLQGVAIQDDAPSASSSSRRVSDCDYSADPLDLTGDQAIYAGACDYSPNSPGPLVSRERAYLADHSGEEGSGPVPRSLSERLAALRLGAEQAHSPACPDDPDADPLSFS